MILVKTLSNHLCQDYNINTMSKLKNSVLRLSFQWVIAFVLTSTVLTIFFCTDNAPFLVYHFFYFPVYFVLSFGTIYLLFFLTKSRFNKKNYLWIIYVFIVLVFSLSLRDFRSTFGIIDYSEKAFSYHRTIASGCREMFRFIALVCSSILMSKQIFKVLDQNQTET